MSEDAATAVQDGAPAPVREPLPPGTRLAGFGALVALLAALAWLAGDAIGPDILGPPEIPVLRPITPAGQVPVDGPGGYYPSQVEPGQAPPVEIPTHPGGGHG